MHFDNYNLHCVISIHALLTESDPGQNLINGIRLIISIHALLTESDIVMVGLLMFSLYFYPRSPYGERLYTMTTIICTASFLSTLSLRRATNAVRIA